MRKDYTAIQDWVGKTIHWELCKIFKVEHDNKRYMHKPGSVQDKVMHKILYDFEIHMETLSKLED